jgi:hypothetical protein
MEKKKLIVNAAICDTRTVTEEMLKTYESIDINAATIIVSTASKELLSRYSVAMNVADLMELSEEAEVLIQNGTFEISEGTIMAKPTVLIVNGSLQIKKNSEKALQTFVSLLVNGSVTYPSGLQNQLPPLKVNGSTNTYPSDAICLKNKVTLDKVFILKAKKAKYYVKNKVVIADESLDISSLVTKGTSFITKNAIITESQLENAVQLFDDETSIDVIPKGFIYVKGSKLDDLMINKNGDKLYVDGDLIITSDSENALTKLTGLRVNGSILVANKLTAGLLNLDVEYNDLKIVKGNIIVDKGILKISKQTLAGKDDGVTIIDCGAIQIDKDITPSEIEEKLQFIDCGVIACHPEQRGVIELVSEDVGLINDKGYAGFDTMSDNSDSTKLYNKNTQVINAASYKM